MSSNSNQKPRRNDLSAINQEGNSSNVNNEGSRDDWEPPFHPGNISTSSVLGIGVLTPNSNSSSTASNNFSPLYSPRIETLRKSTKKVQINSPSGSSQDSSWRLNFWILLCSVFTLLVSISIHAFSFSHDWKSSVRTFLLDLPTSIVSQMLYTLHWSLTFTLTLNIYSFTVVVFLMVVMGYYLFQYLSHFRYSKGPSVERPGETPIGIKPEGGDNDIASKNIKMHNHPAEFLGTFLSSIKVFGYLENEVFNELARNLTQVTLKSDEVLFDKNVGDRSFYVVLEGCIRLYVERSSDAGSKSRNVVRSSGMNLNDVSSNYAVDNNDSESDFHLLNEIKAGGTVSSLFNILSVFTEQLDEMPLSSEAAVNSVLPSENDGIGSSSSSYGRNVPLFPSLGEGRPPRKSPGRSNFSAMTANLDVCAKAKSDTTLLMIPEDAFKKLASKYPTSAAHIVHVILTRFQRVTFLTLNKYLGLSKELIKLERRLRDVTQVEVPLHVIQHVLKDFEKSDNGSSTSLADKKRLRPSHQRTSTLVSGAVSAPDEPGVSVMESKSIIQEQIVDLKETLFDCVIKGIGHDSVGNFNRDIFQRSKEDEIPASFKVSLGGGNGKQGNIIDGSSSGSDSQKSSETSIPAAETSSQEQMPSSKTTEFSSRRQDVDRSVEILHVKKGSFLIRQGDRQSNLYLLIHGLLELSVESQRAFSESVKFPTLTDRFAFTIKTGGIAGYISSLTGNPSMISVCAKIDSCVVCIKRPFLERYVEKHHDILLTLGRRIVTFISPLVRHVDLALDWVNVGAGQVLCKQNEESDGIFIVLHGRLRAIRETMVEYAATEEILGFSEGKSESLHGYNNVQNSHSNHHHHHHHNEERLEVIGEFGQGDSVGELEVLTYEPRQASIHAIRDTELVKLPKTLFHALALRYPEITIQLSRIVATKSASRIGSDGTSNLDYPKDVNFARGRVKTVGILPVNENVPIEEFSLRLRESLEKLGSSVLLKNDFVVKMLGRHAFSPLGKLKLMNWLAEQEEINDIVLYVADSPNSIWTQHCIKQADCILLVGIASEDPIVGDFERLMLGIKTTARKELVLLHSERSIEHGTSQKWLKNRIWIHGHFHIVMPSIRLTSLVNKFQSRRNESTAWLQLKYRIQKYREEFFPGLEKRERNFNDFIHLARRLMGKSIGLVLGGGGAKGLAHIGVIKALEEAGITIDIIGGVSIGAFIGGLYSREPDSVSVLARAKTFATRMSSSLRWLFDMTYPVVSWFSGLSFNRTLWKSFGDCQIEDLWCDYFCLTTNISHYRMEVHRRGYMWRFIRASMSLSGFLPPLCDQGSMLVDGGYLNNLPVDVMRSLGADIIIAVNVARDNDKTASSFPDYVSGWWILLKKCLFLKSDIPTLDEIQSRLTYAWSVRTFEQVRRMKRCFHLKPPVQNFGLMEFASINDICEAGYQYGKECIAAWEKDGTINLLKPEASVSRSGSMRIRRNSI